MVSQIEREFKWGLIGSIRYQIPTPSDRLKISEVRARQGATGHNVRYVLGFGLAGAIIAMTVIYLFYFAVD